MTNTHSDAAYNWFNNPAHTKRFFIDFCAERGFELIDDETGQMVDGWADVAMSVFDSEYRVA